MAETETDFQKMYATHTVNPNSPTLTAEMVLDLFKDLSARASRVPTGMRINPADQAYVSQRLCELGVENITVFGIPFGFEIFEDFNVPMGRAVLVRGRTPIEVITLYDASI